MDMKDTLVKKGRLSTWIVNYESEFGVGAGMVILFIVLTISLNPIGEVVCSGF